MEEPRIIVRHAFQLGQRVLRGAERRLHAPLCAEALGKHGRIHLHRGHVGELVLHPPDEALLEPDHRILCADAAIRAQGLLVLRVVERCIADLDREEVCVHQVVEAAGHVLHGFKGGEGLGDLARLEVGAREEHLGLGKEVGVGIGDDEFLERLHRIDASILRDVALCDLIRGIFRERGSGPFRNHLLEGIDRLRIILQRLRRSGHAKRRLVAEFCLGILRQERAEGCDRFFVETLVVERTAERVVHRLQILLKLGFTAEH